MVRTALAGMKTAAEELQNKVEPIIQKAAEQILKVKAEVTDKIRGQGLLELT